MFNEVECINKKTYEELEFVCDYIEVPDPDPCPWGNCDENPEEPCWDCEEAPNEVLPLDTANNILDTCIKAGVEKAFEVDIKNDFKDIMNGTFLENDNILLKIKDQAIPDTSMLGYFDPLQTVLINSNYVRHGTIYLNSNVLSTSAQEMVVVTMYHELLHAFLDTLSGLYGGLALNHQYMATTFVSKLSNALQGIFSNLSNADATALAWMGLHGTPMWGLKTTAEQNAILSTMNKYKKGTSGTKCK